MPICKFFQNGNCKNGNRCRFDHVVIDDGRDGRNQSSQDRYNEPRGFNQQNRNPFDSAIRQPEPRGYNNQSSGGHQQGQRPGRTPDYGSGPRAGRFFIDEALTRTDLLSDRPEWPLSCYTGAGQGCTDTPKHLIGGVIEQSYEEVRTAYYLAKLNGQEEQARATEHTAAQAANTEIEKVINDMKGAIQYVVNGKREPESRWTIVDECNKQTPNQNRGIFAKDLRPPIQAAPASSRGFGAPSAPSGFSQPSAPSTFGQPPAPSPFGQPSAPAFGQPSSPATFGQPSSPATFGQSSAPAAFGQPSAPSAFGQPSSLAQQSTFGKPTALPQPSGFGQPLQSGQAPAFGKSSAPGAFGALSSGFGAPSASGQNPSPFGKPSPLGQTSAFGQPSNLAHNSFVANKPQVPAFGSAAPFGQASSTASPFGQTSSQTGSPAPNSFGQPSVPAQASPFAAHAPNPNPFIQTSAPQPTSSPFGQSITQPQANPFSQPTQPQSNPFGQSSQPPGQSTFGQPPTSFGQSSAPAAGGFNQPQPTAFANSSPSQHQQPNGFGAPRPETTSSLNTTQPARTSGPVNLLPHDLNAPLRPEDPPEELYDGNKSVFEEAYRWVREHGAFKDGIMPEVAPMHYWVGWGEEEMKFKS